MSLSTAAATQERQCSQEAAEFLQFLIDARATLKTGLVSKNDPRVQQVREPLEDHYLDDRGHPAMYQKQESAIYDDSRSLVTLWGFLERYDSDQLTRWHRLVQLELAGLTGDRHPRKVFDRSPFGIAAIVIMTVTVWMTVVRNFTGEDVSQLLELLHFNWIAGAIWVGGLFVVLWFILKTMRNNIQLAFLGSLDRALTLYLDQPAPPARQRAA